MPSLFVSVSLERLVSVFVALTVALGTAAFCVSVTWPNTVARYSCPQTRFRHPVKTSHAANLLIVIDSSFIVLVPIAKHMYQSNQPVYIQSPALTPFYDRFYPEATPVATKRPDLRLP